MMGLSKVLFTGMAFIFQALLLVKSLEAGEIAYEEPYSDTPEPSEHNILYDCTDLPKFAHFQVDQCKPAIEDLLEKAELDFKELEDKLKDPGRHWREDLYQGVYGNLERIFDPLSYAWGLMGHLLRVQNSDELREVYEELQPKVVEFGLLTGQSETIYSALKILQKGADAFMLDEAQRRIIDNSVRGMEHSGVGLEDEAKERFNELETELAALQTSVMNNILDATDEYALVLNATDEVAGLSESHLALAAQRAISRGYNDSTPENGPWVINLDYPSWLPAMQYLDSTELREQLYIARISRASSGDYNNKQHIADILAKRKELSSILGYNNYAELSLSSKMAKTVETVEQFLESVRDKAYPGAERDLEEIQLFANSKGYKEDLKEKIWDIYYWQEKLKEEVYGVNEEELRPYFQLESVLEGMFELASRLFGVKIEESKEDTEVWHEDVRFYDVRGGDEHHIASFYLDPYSRPEDKSSGAWMRTLFSRSKVLNRKPVDYLILNASPPVDETPSLMTFSEVQTLFHEFGHGLQDMLTEVEYADAAGINGIEWDAVEIASQFMENWLYDEQTVMGMTKHYETGETLPIDIWERLKGLRTYCAGIVVLRQLFYGKVDMELHSYYIADDSSDITALDVADKISETYAIYPKHPQDCFLCTFPHLFATSSYAAGYYSYLWAEVMSADLFGAFTDAGLENERAVKTLGRRYRNTVLALGGSRDPMEVFKDFRGREPDPNFLLAQYGILEDN